MSARLRFYWVVTACGAVIMALEILSSRILAPHFGNSVYVWGSIISVFLAALSLGYLWGGRLADRRPTLAALGRIVAFAALAQGLLLFAGLRLAGGLAAWTGGSPAGPLLAAAVLFGPPGVLLATVSPWAVRLAARDLGHLGDTAGRLYALSTLGSLAGTLGATFLLIPYLELRPSLALLTAATAATALVAMAGELRAQAPAAALCAALIALSASGGGFASRPVRGLVYERVTPYQTLQVLDRGGARHLESDRVRQAAVDLATGEPALPYPRYAAAALALRPETDRMLVLGLGGGSVGMYLRRRLPALAVDYVDIDPAVPRIARRYLRFEEGPRDRVHVADARRFLQGSAERWDLIYCDTYIGLSVPFHLTTVQFLYEVKRHLEPGGVFGLNLAAGLEDAFSRAIYRTVRERFASAYVFRVTGRSNVLVLASDAPALDPEALRERARGLDRRLRFDPSIEAIVSRRIAVELRADEVPVLTDEYAPVDRLIRLGERSPPPAAADTGSTASRRR
jgi:spermidine synthase